MNLTRFGILFPERREFFIENSGSFLFGDVVERNYRMGSSLSDFSLFNSRAIGLTPDGLPIPIAGGGRLTGRASGWEVGLFDMQTERSGRSPSENFGVARVRRNILGSSDIGVLVANREATDSTTYNRSYGVDANIRLFGNVIVNSYVAATSSDTATSNGRAGRVSVGYRNAFWNTSAMHKRVSAGFNPGIGFVNRRDFAESYATLGVHARPNWSGIQEVAPYVSGTYFADPAGPMQSRTVTAGLDVLFQPDGQVGATVNDHFDRLDKPFTVVTGRTIPVGRYAFRDASLTYSSSQARRVYGVIGATAGEFYDGTRAAINGTGTWRPRYDLSFDGTYQHNNIALPTGNFVADVGGVRAKYSWSTTLIGSTFVQYNTQSKSFVTNARMAWRYSPLSDLFLVYTERENTLLNVRNERSVAFKVTRMVAF